MDDEQIRLLLSGLEKVSFLSLRGRIYEQLYNSNSNNLDAGVLSSLETALISLYKEILAFLSLALKRLGKSRPRRAMGALFNPEEVTERLQRIDDCATETDREASNCDRWINRTERDKLYHLMDKKFVFADAKTEALYVNMSAENHLKALTWISPITYVSDHEFAKQGRVGGTGAWLLERSELQKWYQSIKSGIFWLHGIRR